MASYTILNYFLLVGFFGFLYAVFIYLANTFVDLQNIFISGFPGIITEQTVNAAMFGIGVLQAAPFVLFVAVATWAFVRGGST